MRDHVTMRLLHTGIAVTHVHHLHAHQWLRSPNSDDSHYLDSQMIAPGSTYTLEMVYNGSGNRNETVGDAIFHCHFYPHFAGGMWALWRIHDVFEAGTRLDAEGRPVAGWNRALPDAEITAGTPIPAVVPLPSLAMAIAPAPVRLIDDGQRVEVAAKTTLSTGEPVYDNPGYPFFVPGVSGHRAPHPPIDFAWEEEKAGQPKRDADGKKIYLDGGLPRHQVLDGTIVRELHTRWDFSKDFIAYDKAGKPIAGGLVAYELPEEGTAVEKAAMATHAQRAHASFLPNGDPGNFILNGLPPAPGAPYANPSVDDNGNGEINTRRYQGAAIQLDVALTKQGWHYPQQRVLTLWQDVAPTIGGERAPQPLFFRANTGETIEFWHTNLVPDYYDLDDFQVRTPTDIIGQHIHLVKFDVTSSDGAGNGFTYEDGTFSPDEVRGRIDAINLSGGLYSFDPATQFKGSTQQKLTAKPAPAVFGSAPAGQNWTGAQTTIQRWDTDPVENNQGEDRTLRTVFTHDHFGPSTHQQVGLYGGLLVEPQGSKWYDPVSGGLLYDTKIRQDGGPTGWQANIVTANPADSYRSSPSSSRISNSPTPRRARPGRARPARRSSPPHSPSPPGR
jgi:manganese oxidase